MSWSTPSPEGDDSGPSPGVANMPPAPEHQYGPPGGPSYAGWWKRVAGALIDSLVVGVPLGIANAVIGGNLVRTDRATNTTTIHIGTRGVLSTLVFMALSFTYFVILEGGPRGQSVGKMALGIQLRDAATGGAVGYGRALGRRLLGTALWWLLVVPGMVDDLWPLWDDRRQTLHDKAVNAVVVDVG
ncbi:MAG: RDD family protein [Acidimicrobiales bacterium]